MFSSLVHAARKCRRSETSLLVVVSWSPPLTFPDAKTEILRHLKQEVLEVDPVLSRLRGKCAPGAGAFMDTFRTWGGGQLRCSAQGAAPGKQFGFKYPIFH